MACLCTDQPPAAGGPKGGRGAGIERPYAAALTVVGGDVWPANCRHCQHVVDANRLPVHKGIRTREYVCAYAHIRIYVYATYTRIRVYVYPRVQPSPLQPSTALYSPLQMLLGEPPSPTGHVGGWRPGCKSAASDASGTWVAMAGTALPPPLPLPQAPHIPPGPVNRSTVRHRLGHLPYAVGSFFMAIVFAWMALLLDSSSRLSFRGLRYCWLIPVHCFAMLTHLWCAYPHLDYVTCGRNRRAEVCRGGRGGAALATPIPFHRAHAASALPLSP